MNDELAGWLLDGGGHRLRVRVYFEDTDFTGLVYHARTLHFLERGRTDFLRLLGIDHRALAAGAFGVPCFFAVRRMSLDFAAPAGIDDILEVTTRISQVGGARIGLDQRIERDGRLVASAGVEVAVLAKDGRPQRLPADLVAQLREEPAPASTDR